MKHTSEALQTLGMKVSDADNIMLDLEDSASDMSSMQNTLSASHFDNDMNDIDLNDELALLLSDSGFEPVFSAHAVKEVKESPAQISAPESATAEKPATEKAEQAEQPLTAEQAQVEQVEQVEHL
jgi:hypothetical protein